MLQSMSRSVLAAVVVVVVIDVAVSTHQVSRQSKRCTAMNTPEDIKCVLSNTEDARIAGILDLTAVVVVVIVRAIDVTR